MTKNRSLVDEQMIRDYGYEYTYATVALDALDAAGSLHLQNRGSTTLNPEHVAAMATSLEVNSDHQVPAIVVAKVGEKLLILNGNHRTAASVKAGRDTIDAYVIDNPDQGDLEAMALEANATSGLSLSHDERMGLALRYAEATGDLQMASVRFGVSAVTLGSRRRAQAGREKARAAGITAPILDAKAEVLNRLDVDQVKILGPALVTKVSTPNLLASVNNILATPASERAERVVEERGRLAGAIAAKSVPAAKRKVKAGMTVAAMLKGVRQVTQEIKGNPGLRNNADLVAAIDAIHREVHRGA